MNILASLSARWRNYKVEHFDRFEGKALRQYKDIHRGRRCFIIGNGPSLTAKDLDTLAAHNEITFAFNRIYNIFPETHWRPTYYISQDEKMLAGCVAEVNRIQAQAKFIPIELDWYYDIHLDHVTPFHVMNGNEANPDFSTDISRLVYNSKTCVYTAIQFAYYMGIREIYLIGVDHHFHISRNARGEIVVDPTAKDYFSEAYNQDKANLYIPNTDLSTLTFLSAKRHSDQLGFRIYNATRGGMLEVFERKEFDSLF